MSANRSTLGPVNWRVARSCDGGGCVGVAQQGEFIFICNTTHPDGSFYRFTPQAWRKFTANVKVAGFNHPD